MVIVLVKKIISPSTGLVWFSIQRFLLDGGGKVEVCARSSASKEQRTEPQS